MGFERVGLPFLYLYGVGGALFFAGLGLAIRSRALQPRRREDRRWLRILLFGFFWYALLHGLTILAALYA
ncbi:MAG: hypothetical protein ACE5H3_00555 [Planctomycetota bacterium]